MNIDVIFSASEITDSAVAGKTVVVIDVLRATSVMVTALGNGASKVIPVLTRREAFDFRKNHTGKVVLAGERHSERIEGFDFGNSPLDMTPENIAEASLVMTTTNGTRAIRKSELSADLFVAGFINAEATTETLKKYDDVVLVCSGSNNTFTMEDTLCAGYMIDLLKLHDENICLTDASVASLHLFLGTKDDLHALAGRGRHYLLLKEKNLLSDIDFCFSKNKTNAVCKMYGSAIMLE